jgi:uncharacterized Zn finger protein
MKCPECGSTDHERLREGPHDLRKAVEKWGTTWRVHKCLKCGKMFMSQQRAMTMSDAAIWMNHLEAGPTTQPSSGSEPTPTSKG